MKNIIYRYSRRFFLTAPLTKKIETRMEILYPSTKYSIINRTAEYLMRLYLAAGLTMFGMLIFAEFSVYYAVLTGMVVYAVVNAKVYGDLEKLEMKLLMQLEKFVSDMKFRFQFDGMLEEAIQDAINYAEYEMSIQGEKLLGSLKNYNRKDYEDYTETAPDNFFLTLYSICLMVLKYGDKKVEKESIFVQNLGYLKQDIHIEQLKRKKMHSEFAGLGGLTILPLFAIQPIEMWAVSNIPEMKMAYEGIQGSFLTIFIGLLTLGIYQLIQLLKRNTHKEFYKNKKVEKAVRIEAINRLVMSVIVRQRKKSERRNRLLLEVGYPYNLAEYTFLKWCYAGMAGTTGILVFLSMAYPLWSILLAGICFGGIGYASIYMGILIKRQILIMEREEEIVRFQTIILMIMYIDRITVEEILSGIEKFAVAFRRNIYELSNLWSYKGFQVFEEEKGKTGFHPYEKLLDSFLACDSMPVPMAFADVKADRNYYVEKHKQENEELIHKKSLIAKTVAFLPLCLVILLKLILPFVAEGLSALYESSNLL